MECLCEIKWFLAHIKYIKQQVTRYQNWSLHVSTCLMIAETCWRKRYIQQLLFQQILVVVCKMLGLLYNKGKYLGWQWRNFFIHIYASCFGRHDVGQGNVNILQHLQSARRSSSSTELILNLLIQFYLNNVANLHQLLCTVRHQAVQHGDRIVITN